MIIILSTKCVNQGKSLVDNNSQICQPSTKKKVSVDKFS